MMGEHPAVRHALRYGVAEAASPECPYCSAEAEVFYFDRDRECIGCECCVRAVEWWEVGA